MRQLLVPPPPMSESKRIAVDAWLAEWAAIRDAPGVGKAPAGGPGAQSLPTRPRTRGCCPVHATRIRLPDGAVGWGPLTRDEASPNQRQAEPGFTGAANSERAVGSATGDASGGAQPVTPSVPTTASSNHASLDGAVHRHDATYSTSTRTASGATSTYSWTVPEAGQVTVTRETGPASAPRPKCAIAGSWPNR